MAGRYAENTTVPTERSKSEIEQTLMRYGASHFGYAVEPERAIVQFRAQGRGVRFVLPMPDPNDERFTHHSRGERTAAAQQKEYEQATRQAWRALALAIKAKLECVATGIASFEQEFLANILLPDGTTVGQWAAPQIEHAYESNAMPTSLLALPPGITKE